MINFSGPMAASDLAKVSVAMRAYLLPSFALERPIPLTSAPASGRLRLSLAPLPSHVQPVLFPIAAKFHRPTPIPLLWPVPTADSSVGITQSLY